MTGLHGTILLLLSVLSYDLAVGSLDNPTRDYPYPRIILMGPSGVGKSTMANVLAGCLPNDNSCFKTCPGSRSCTNETTLNVVTYLGDDASGTLTLLDTPGFGSTGIKGDGPIIANTIDVLKHSLGEANMILLCLDYNQRFGPVMQNMIRELETLFGRQQVWDHISIEVTKWKFSEGAIRDRNISGITEDYALTDINEQIMKISHLNKILPGVFIDSFATMYPDDENQQEYYQKYTKDLWDMAVGMPLLQFKSVKDILLELSECHTANDCCEELEARLTQVEADVVEVRKVGDHNSDDISTLDTTVIINKDAISYHSDAIRNHSDAISGNSATINSNFDAIRNNSDVNSIQSEAIFANFFTISGHSIAISNNSDAISNSIDAISDNYVNIQSNNLDILANTFQVAINTGAIDELEHTPVVGVCAWRDKTTSTGTITYNRLYSLVHTDHSTMNTATGKYTVTTTGLFSITMSAWTHGLTLVYLVKNGVQQDETAFSNNQGSASVQSSRSVVLCLREGDEIHLVATQNGDINDMQFCVTLENAITC